MHIPWHFKWIKAEDMAAGGCVRKQKKLLLEKLFQLLNLLMSQVNVLRLLPQVIQFLILFISFNSLLRYSIAIANK